jgi:hypothetical protein
MPATSQNLFDGATGLKVFVLDRPIGPWDDTAVPHVWVVRASYGDTEVPDGK